MKGAATMVREPIRRVTVGRWSAELLPRQPYEAQYVADRPILGFAFESQAGAHAYASDRIRPFRARPNGLAYVPKGCDVFSRSSAGGEYLILRGFELKGPSGVPFSDRSDSAAAAAAHALRRLVLSHAPCDSLSYEAPIIALVERLQSHMDQEPDRRGAADSMTAARLKRIEEMIEARLGGALTVQELADELGLSTGFFARAFKAAAGRSPHAYILDRRLARARALLASGIKDLCAIALATGFSSHAHLTTAFRQRLGISPSAYRRGLAAAAVGHP
ncbi:Transcriptional regulator, AraC family (plasmid) [Sinorhizobium sojae CCBAU 05684]|uniref:Transcriptional regulator, AraC family n=1 Tax=Sinorhizobium sojae CCBAU 05684 TaxID=716928 RepID=A0A249PL87_9HYPH|nr:AraC family transcriptional regulator [Sinorhizobium sojae]ASY66700.1 Transcriptional regulator, AraC family [Sinorhizobium sojae CCBAU 05684]